MGPQGVAFPAVTLRRGRNSVGGGPMFATKRLRIAATALAVALLSGGIAAAVTSTASASPRPKPAATSTRHRPGKLTLTRFDLKGYVINAKYTLGRNTGNTFQQTYQGSTVLGVPI